MRLRSLSQLTLVLLYLCYYVSSSSLPKIRGISPEDQGALQYDSEHFVCKDGSKDIPFSRVNDDFCDCKDGSDEPGTTACPNGMFYCENKPHIGKKIHSSLLFDGICDCCDGSDEATGLCPNNCKQLAEEALKGKREQLANYRKGVRVKKEYIAQATEGLVAKEQELEKKKLEVEDLKKERDSVRAVEEELKKKEEAKKEELKAKAEQQKQDNQEQQAESTENKPQEEAPVTEEVPETENQEVETAGEETDEEQVLKEEEEGEWPQEVSVEEEDEELKALKDELKKVRDNVHDLDSKIRSLEREISDLNKVLEVNFGANKEFFALYGKCFEVQTAEYTYELCPFDKVTQKQKHGGGGTSLGTWHNNQNAQWSNEFKLMEYTNGLRCWGGPDRSTKVEVLCDAENRISDPQEPNKCEYSLKFYTPAACSEAHSLALQLELESALGSIIHDEL